MKLKVKNSAFKKIYNKKFNVTFIADYKQKDRLKIPSKIVFDKKYILLGILWKRQSFNEIRTIRAVEDCRRLVLEQIEMFFEQKERIILNLIPELIIKRKSYKEIIDNNDLAVIYSQAKKIINNELFKRFNRLIEWENKYIYGNWTDNILTSIEKYQAIKKQTVLITSCMESVSRKALSDSLELLIENSFVSKVICEVDFSTMLLPKLGIDSGSENTELNLELQKRITGALQSIKLRFVREVNNLIANVFYEIHDLLLNSNIEHKINLLESKIIREEVYEADLMEA